MAKVEPIEGVDLEELIQETAGQVVAEKRQSTQRLVRIVLDRIYSLKEEVERARKHLSEREEALKKAQDKITRLQKGDWSALEGLDVKPEK